MSPPPPDWFKDVRNDAARRWQQLEDDPELRGPWEQLFRQVQSPVHVTSELLQNADDAGASFASVRIEESTFIFEHDGKDFDESDFRSLCSFGRSNKTNLWTIGFRGMGFKSLFSLGDEVRLLTRTLAVSFKRDRFTLPEKLQGERPAESVRVEIPLGDSAIEAELVGQIDRWRRSPLPILFFRHLQRVWFSERTFEKRSLGQGQIEGSEVFSLDGSGLTRLTVIPLDLGALPDDCLREIEDERRATTVSDSQTQVRLSAKVVLGKGVDRKLFVVLPTSIEPGLPFALNAPFIQDPARTGLKDLSQSPMNRWILKRAGEEVGKCFLRWLGNDELPLELRAEAYGLVPATPPKDSPEATGERAGKVFLEAFRESVDGRPVILTASGGLADCDDVANFPEPILNAWSARDVARIFRYETREVIAPPAARYSTRLEKWGWLQPVDEREICSALTDGSREALPRPPDEALWAVWRWFGDVMERRYNSRQRSQKEKEWRSALLVPVAGSQRLGRATELARLPETRPDGISEEQWTSLRGLVDAVDPAWIRFVEDRPAEASGKDASARAGWETLGLGKASSVERVWRRACAFVFSEGNPDARTVAELLHVAAVRGIELSEVDRELICLPCRDKKRRPVKDGLLLMDPALEELFPPDWVGAHSIDDGFLSQLRDTMRRDVVEWLSDHERSGVGAAPVPRKKESCPDSEETVKNLYRERGAGDPSFPYKGGGFRMVDYDFEPDMWDFLINRPLLDNSAWSKFFASLVETSAPWLRDHRQAQVERVWGDNPKPVRPNLPAAWVVRLRNLPCLKDEYGAPRSPCELLLPTPENLKFSPVDHLLEKWVYREELEDLLLDLGVRKAPTRWKPIVDRLGVLAEAGNPSVDGAAGLYRLLDGLVRTLGRDDPEDLERLREVFRHERLVPTDDGWATAEHVFLGNPDDIPGVELVHEALRALALWPDLGVEDRPTKRDALRWVQELPAEERLGDLLERARGVLTRYAKDVLDRTGRWLALDGSLRPVDEFRWRTTATGAPPGLDPWLARVTADVEGVARPMPRALYRLQQLTKRLTCEVVGGTLRGEVGGPAGSWLADLGNVLLTVEGIRSGDGDTPKGLSANGARAIGRQMKRVRVLRFDSPSVRYLLDGRYVSTTRPVNVAWVQGDLVVAEAPGPHLQRAVVRELCEQLDVRPLGRLLDQCFCRGADWIRRSALVLFELKEDGDHTAPLVNGERQPVRPAPPAPGSGCTDDQEGRPLSTGGETPSVALPAATGDSGGTLKRGGGDIESRLERAGFALSPEGSWIRGDERIWKTKDDTFPWAYSSPELGDRHAWLFRGDLTPGAVFRIPFKTWQKGPETGAVLLSLGRDSIQTMTFSEIQSRLASGQLRIDTDSIRIVWIRNGS